MNDLTTITITTTVPSEHADDLARDLTQDLHTAGFYARATQTTATKEERQRHAAYRVLEAILRITQNQQPQTTQQP